MTFPNLGQAVIHETDVASATTCDLSAVTTWKVRITGTTNIAAITMKPYQLLWVTMQGALTITHNATTLFLPNAGSNITTAANDKFVLSADGSANVTMRSYQRASGAPLAVIGAALGGTGVANNAANTLTWSGAFAATFTLSNTTSVTFPTAGTLATLAGTEEFTNKTLNAAVGKGTWTASGTWTLPALTLGGAITYGGVTLSNAVTGTGNMVLSASPTFTGTVGAAAITATGNIKSSSEIATGASASLNGVNGLYSCALTTNSAYLFFQNATTGELARVLVTNSKSLVFTVDAGATQHLAVSSGRIAFGVPASIKSYTVATLPAGNPSDFTFASNCRMFNGTGTQEGVGAGTGGEVCFNGSAWKIAGTNVTAIA